MMEDLLIFGAGGHAKVIVATIEAAAQFRIIGLVSDVTADHGREYGRYRVLGGRETAVELWRQGIQHAAIAVGDNLARMEILIFLQTHRFWLPHLKHPTATVLDGATVGAGSVVLPYAFVGADVRIGMGCILGVHSGTAHDCSLGDGVHLACGARMGGHVTVARLAFIGMNAAILSHVTVGEGATIGAGAVVTHDVEPGQIVTGIPARRVI